MLLSGTGSMFIYLFLFFVGGYSIYIGVTMIKNNKWVGRYNIKYTKKSMNAFAKKGGIMTIIMGVWLIICGIALRELGTIAAYVTFGIFFVILIVYYVMMKKTFKRKLSYKDEE